MYSLIAVVLLVIVAGAVGGGVGGALGSRNSTASSTSTTPISSTTSTTSGRTDSAPSATLQSVNISTSTIVAGPSQTVYRDCPSSNDTIYAVQGSGGAAPLLFHKACGYSFKGRIAETRSFVQINQQAKSLDECIGLAVAQNTLNATSIARGDIAPCNTVCWRNGSPGDDFPFQCFGEHITNSTDGFKQGVEAICDSAVWINE
ncbi:unnamed protein product [Zymoseptoria tritici ST99CH_1A5]|uniref:Uncharacterized protein n=3 Tax=Zymoseptoria tritici TaxID=1047171 RepID=F9X512_ZYMTI|nr:uncharacterized protein MYCGRDRAFT_91690 [Zymoseptoria tritici IPO323]EGP88801.1 hypothetical protein MYCGRDRAFT_91690 [Zymoseptoria tritici IPO323]SMR48623.1 unnamed protein product [Zymoseptoria tritici ST99CH_1E4]SMY22506.1 unnamed protein product [Zymoseptoria tritici ST99CH_1A5]